MSISCYAICKKCIILLVLLYRDFSSISIFLSSIFSYTYSWHLLNVKLKISIIICLMCICIFFLNFYWAFYLAIFYFVNIHSNCSRNFFNVHFMLVIFKNCKYIRIWLLLIYFKAVLFFLMWTYDIFKMLSYKFQS